MSEITLEKVDVLRERLGVSYGLAKATLEKTGGDVIEALVLLEEEQNREADIKNQIIQRIRSLIAKGNARKIRVKKDGKTVAEIPAGVGAIGLLGTLAYTPLAVVGAIGSISAMFNRYTLEIENNDGAVEEQPLMAEDQLAASPAASEEIMENRIQD